MCVVFILLKGANLITGAIILNGIACGMIYRPLEATRRKVVTAVDGGRQPNVPRSAIFRKIIEDKKRRRTTSTGSLDGTVITRDNRVVQIEMTDSVANSLRAIPEHAGEDDSNSNVNKVSSTRTAHTICVFKVINALGNKTHICHWNVGENVVTVDYRAATLTWLLSPLKAEYDEAYNF